MKVIKDYAFGIICATGMYFFFVNYGLVQEQIFSYQSPEGDKFRNALFLVALLSLTNFVISGGLLYFFGGPETQVGDRPFDLHRRLSRNEWVTVLTVAFSYCGAMTTTNLALTYIDYPTQVLVKSAKTIPVVVGGFLLYRKVYPWYDYLTVALVSLGLVVFNYKPGSSMQAKNRSLGLMFLGFSLLCDGLTGPRQDAFLKRTKLSSLEFMYSMNISAFMWTFIGHVVMDGTEPYLFLIKNTGLMKYLLLFCLTGVAGQVCLFLILSKFGSLTLTLMTTLRKFFTVLCSVMVYNHSMTALQWAAVVEIFVVLIGHAVMNVRHKAASAKDKAPRSPPIEPEKEDETTADITEDELRLRAPGPEKEPLLRI